MSNIISKSDLAIVLSRLLRFEAPKLLQEQYVMDSEVGAAALWHAHLLGDLNGRVIADLGCGTGILGIGALLLGAGQVIFVDSDADALKMAQNNYSKVRSEGYKLGRTEFLKNDISKLKIKADVVIENPPFGTKLKHADIKFLEKALETAHIVYSFHKSESKNFLQRFAARNNANITHIWDFRFPIKSTFSFHRRQIHRVNVSCLRFERD